MLQMVADLTQYGGPRSLAMSYSSAGSPAGHPPFHPKWISGLAVRAEQHLSRTGKFGTCIGPTYFVRVYSEAVGGATGMLRLVLAPLIRLGASNHCNHPHVHHLRRTQSRQSWSSNTERVCQLLEAG